MYKKFKSNYYNTFHSKYIETFYTLERRENYMPENKDLDLINKIKKGEKLTSEDLNSNTSNQCNGLESVTEGCEKWFYSSNEKKKK